MVGDPEEGTDATDTLDPGFRKPAADGIGAPVQKPRVECIRFDPAPCRFSYARRRINSPCDQNFKPECRRTPQESSIQWAKLHGGRRQLEYFALDLRDDRFAPSIRLSVADRRSLGTDIGVDRETCMKCALCRSPGQDHPSRQPIRRQLLDEDRRPIENCAG